MTIYEYLGTLRNGILPEDSTCVREKAMELYNAPSLNQTQVQEMDTLLRICNILYNRTDLEVLPVEDGLYDVLLEKYKPYNPNFQVGSEVINFKSTGGSGVRNNGPVSPFSYITAEQENEIANGFYTEDLYEGVPPIGEVPPIPSDLKCPFSYDGSVSKRTHNTEHSHPQLVGTLDKSKFVMCSEAENEGVIGDSNVKVLERDFFAEHIKKGILDPNRQITIIMELKYDGISVEADCSDIVRSARTRGDTGIGKASDITPILYGYSFPNAVPLSGENVGVKFEAIITYEDLYKLNKARNTSYANGRTAIVGLFGCSDAPLYRDLITLVPLAIDRDDVPVQNRLEEIAFLNQYYATHNQPLRYAVAAGTYKECLYQIHLFQKEAEIARRYLNFMYDGIVISYLDEDIRQALGRENYINKYSMAVKFNPLVKQTHFLGYSYTVGQDGTITPMIHYEPVEFFGTIHDKSSGHSYDRFKKLNLKIGDVLEVKYVNDVMPYVYKAECIENDQNTNAPESFIDTCPECGEKLEVSKSGKTVVCKNIRCKGRLLAKMVNMLQKLNIKGFSTSRLDALGAHNLTELYSADYKTIENAFGSAYAGQFVVAINALRSNPINDYEIMGALGFTSIASKTWKSILSHYTLNEILTMYYEGSDFEILSSISGIGESTIKTIRDEFELFYEDIAYILTLFNIVDSKGKAEAPAIRCTGFRDEALMKQLRDMGYDADGNASVTKKTAILLIPQEGHSSSKIKKAGENTLIIPVVEFREHMDEYLAKI